MPEPGLPAPSGGEQAEIRISASEQVVDTGTLARIALGEHEMRRDLASGILRAFVVGNSAVWIIVIMLVAVDVILITTGNQAARDRVIDRSVIKVLVGATAVQVGLIMVAIAGNLFPKVRAGTRAWWKVWD